MDNLIKDKKLIALVAYITPIGFIIAFILNKKLYGDDRLFSSLHLRQAFGLYIIAFGTIFGVLIIMSILPFFSSVLQLTYQFIAFGSIFLAVVGMINASKGLKKVLPLIGERIEKHLGSKFS